MRGDTHNTALRDFALVPKEAMQGGSIIGLNVGQDRAAATRSSWQSGGSDHGAEVRSVRSRKSWHQEGRRQSLTEQIVGGGDGARCSIVGDAYEEEFAEPEPGEESAPQRRKSLAETVTEAQRKTLLDDHFVREMERKDPALMVWLRSSAGFLAQLGLFAFYVGLDCSKSIFTSKALKGGPMTVSQSIPICQSMLQIILGIASAVSFLGKPALKDIFDIGKIIKYSPVALIFAAAQSFQVLSYSMLSAGTIKILGQARLLQTALLSKLLLGKDYMLTQWTVIIMIVMSAAVFCSGAAEWKSRYSCMGGLGKLASSSDADATLAAAVRDWEDGGSGNLLRECMVGADSADADNFLIGVCYVFIYLFLSDMASIISESFMKGETDTPYYIQKVWAELAGFPSAILMSVCIPLLQNTIGRPEDEWRPNMWWSSNCGDPEWYSNRPRAQDAEVDESCGGLFLNWRGAVVLALLFSTTHSWCSGLVVKKLSSLMKLLGKCASLALVYFIGDCWLLAKPGQEPAPVCVIAALMVMVGTFTFMNIKAPKKEEPAAPVADANPAIEMPTRGAA